MSARVVRFGIFELDCDTRELRKRGVRVRLQDQPLDILLMLVERPGELIARDDIRDRLWPVGTFVEFEQSIGTAIRKLRVALHDNAETPHVIETVPRRGYRFLLPVVSVTGLGSLQPESGHRLRQLWLRLCLAAGAVAALTIVLVLNIHRAPVWHERTLKRVTFDEGLQFGATWSPDGHFLAFSSNRDGKYDIWVQRIGGIGAVKITSGPGPNWQPDWSPAEDLIAFRSERDDGGIFVVPAHGGPEKKIAAFGYHPRWSPDGRQVLFDSTYFPSMWNRLYVVSMDGSAPQENLTEKVQQLGLGERTVGWHPDGKRLSLWASAADNGPAFWTVPLGQGTPVRSQIDPEIARKLRDMSLQYSGAGTVADFRWAPSGRAIYFIGQSGGVWNLWKVAVDPVTLRWTALERLTTGPEAHTDLAISRDGEYLAFTPRASGVRVWVWPFDPAAGKLLGTGRSVTPAGVDSWTPDLSPDGTKLAFSVLRAGKWELWEKSLDGGAETLLANDGQLRAANWSPDGKRLHLSIEGMHENISSLIMDGGGIEQRITIPTSCYCLTEAWSPDQQWLIGEGWDRSRTTKGVRYILFFLRLPTTHPPKLELREITFSRTDGLYEPRVSPDGNWIAFVAVKGGAVAGMPAENPAIFVVRASGGEWIRITGDTSWNDKPRWSPDGKTIYFLSTRNGLLNLWGARFDALKGEPSGKPFQVTHFGVTGLMIAERDITLLETTIGRNALALPMTEASGSIWMLDSIDR